jgi:hypothetical protein
VREVDEASAHNLEIARQLLGAQNACGAPSRQASADDPFEVSDLRVVAALPSVGNLTSDCANASLLWSWSASYPSAATFELPAQGGCPSGELEIYLPSRLQLRDASLAYVYCGKERLAGLSGEGPNPVALQLGSGADCSENSSVLQLPLQARISGSVAVSYSYRKSEYGKRCSLIGGYEACGCELETEFGTKQYSKRVGGSSNFSVEAGTVEALWVSPPLQKRLDGRQAAQIAIFTRRMPSLVSVRWNGEKIAENSPYRFNVSAGECGQREVSAEYSPEELGLALNRSESALNVRQLASINSTFLPFSGQFYWQAEPGAGEASVGFEDWFCARQAFPRNFSARAPAGFQSDAGLLQVREGSDRESPAASSPKAGPLLFGSLHAAAGALLLAAVLWAALGALPRLGGRM